MKKTEGSRCLSDHKIRSAFDPFVHDQTNMTHMMCVATTCNTMDELERIKATKMQEMMKRASRSQDSSHERAPAELSDTDFDQTIRSKPLVVVDCWAAWCYPCRMIAPILEEMAVEYGSVAMFAKLNVDETPSTAMRYGIQSIPTILIIKNGVEVERIVGAVPKAQIEAALKKHL